MGKIKGLIIKAMGRGQRARVVCIVCSLLTVLIVFLVLRGPHVSNLLKRLILPEISAATGRNVTVQNIYLNLFPLFIEARGFRAFEDGREVMHVPRIKGYIDLSRILRKEIVIRRLVIKEPDIRMDASQLEDIIERIKVYIKREEQPPVKVRLKSISLDKGSFGFSYRDIYFRGGGLGGDAVISAPGVRVRFTLEEITPVIKGWPELKADLKGSIDIKGNTLDINGLQVGFYGSTIDAGGTVSLSDRTGVGPKGTLDTRLRLLMESFKKVFGLERRAEGEVSAKGTLRLMETEGWDRVPGSAFIDMDLKGNFYIQALMELLKVKERVEGLVDFKGSIKGPLTRPSGDAAVRLTAGNLFGVDVDDLRCRILYRDGLMDFKDGRAALYNGHATADASLKIPGAEYYSLKVRFSDVDSHAVLDLIGWRPDIPPGKVRGELITSGAGFNPSGWFQYEAINKTPHPRDDVMGRISRAKGYYRLHNDVLTLLNSEAGTEKSTLTADGDIDLSTSNLSIDFRLRTADVTDITLPYLHELRGSGELSGTLKGRFSDPVIDATAGIHSASYGDYYLGDVEGDLSYKKDLLEVKRLSASLDKARPGQATATMVHGRIGFKDPDGLFDFKRPVYGLTVSIKNGDIERFTGIIYRQALKLHPWGRFDAGFVITGMGPTPVYRGSITLNKASVDRVAIDSGSLLFSYDYRELSVSDASFRKGESTLNVRGVLSHSGSFDFKASGSRLALRDIVPEEIQIETRIDLTAEGRGTLNDPEIELDSTIHRGRFRDMVIDGGRVRAFLKGKNLQLEAALFNGMVTLNGKGYMKDNMPWTARMDIRPGRYNFLLGAFLKDVPEDLLFNMKGYVEMSGDRSHFSADGVLNQANITLYGYSFSNESAIRFALLDRKLSLSALRMRSGSTSFRVSGGMEIGRGYDLVMEGSSSLAPLKGFSKRIDALRGETEFVIAVSGGWDAPRINGGVTISNAFLGIKGIPYRISSVDGYLYIDEQRIVMQRLSGRVGGGDITISGVAYLRGFKMKRFYVDAVLNSIGVNVSRDFPVDFNGNILYKGDLSSQTISGEIRIKRARYRERVEWKSWLLKARPKERPRGELGALERAALNIRVYGSDNIAIDNNIARASLKLDLLLRGTVSYPVLFGRVESKSGTVYFRNNEFRILNASADFSDPRRINPVMEIVAETSIKGYNIRLNLEGQMEHFNLSLLSDPPLEEIDILSLLTVGRFGRELKGIEGGIGAGEATSFLTGKFQDVLEERVRSLTGLDRLEVGPYVSRTTGAVSPQVTVSKRLLGDRLFVTYSSAVGIAESNNVLRLEYILDKHISLIGVRDEKGGIGGDVKFRFEFK